MNNLGEELVNKKLVILIFIFLAFGFYLDKIILGPSAIIRLHDTFDGEFPRYYDMGQLFLHHGFIGWYSNFAGGMPSYAWHVSPFYSLNLLSAVLPSWSLYGTLVIALMVIAGYGMYRFMFEYLGLSYWVSFIGGIFSSLITQIQPNAVVFAVFNYVFPISFVWLLAIIRSTSLRMLLTKIIGINLIFLLTYITLALPMFYVLQVLIITFANFNFKEETKRMLFWSTVIWGGFVLTSAPTLYQLFEFSPLAHRNYPYPPVTLTAFTTFIVSAFNIFKEVSTSTMLFIPTIASLSLIGYSVKVRRISFVTIVVLMIAAFFDSPFKVIFSETIVIKMDLARFSWTLPFLFTILSFVGIQELFSIKVLNFRYFLSAIIASFLLVSLSYPADPVRLSIFVLNILTFLFISFSYIYFLNLNESPQLKPIATLVCVFLVVCGALFVVGVRTIRMFGEGEIIPYAKYFDNHTGLRKILRENDTSPFRVGAINLLPSIIQQYEIETADGRGPLFYKYYKDYFKLIIAPQLKTKEQGNHFDNYWPNLLFVNGGGSLDFNVPLLLAMNVRYLVSPRMEKALESISSKVVTVEPDSPDPFGLYAKLLASNISIIKRIYPPSLYVYQLRDSFDRAFLVRKAIVLPSDEKVLQAMSTQTLQTLRDSAFFSGKELDIPDFVTGKYPSSKFNMNELEMIYYSPDKIIFNAVLYTPGILVMTNNYDPKWTALVNGQQTKIYRANHAFQSIFFKQSGNYFITFEYKNPLLWLLHGLIPVGIILINLIVFYKGVAFHASCGKTDPGHGAVKELVGPTRGA